MALPGMSNEYYQDLEFYSAWQQAMNPGQAPMIGGENLSDPAFLAWKQQQGIGVAPQEDPILPQPPEPLRGDPSSQLGGDHLYDAAGTRYEDQPGWTNSTVASYLADGNFNAGGICWYSGAFGV